MNNSLPRKIQLTLVLIDLISITIVFLFGNSLYSSPLQLEGKIENFYLVSFLSIAWLVIAIFADIYNEAYIRRFEVFCKKSAKGLIYFFSLVFCYLYLFHSLIIPKEFLVFVITIIPFSFLINRFLYLLTIQYVKSKLSFQNNVLIVGYNQVAKQLATTFENAEGIKKTIVGFCEETENVSELSNYPILGSIGDTMDVCRKHSISEVYSTIAPEHNPAIYSMINEADKNCIRFKLVPDFSFFIKKKIFVDYFYEIPVISLRSEPLEDVASRILKRIFDITFSLFVIFFILSWLIPIVALIIYLDNKGPIFFIQERTGKNSRPFMCLKFRSMRMNNDANLKQASKNDPRITRIGRILRRTNLDELPQFFNVLRGDMSIVGPRPHMVKHTDIYSNLINQYMIRQFAKPGITGWAQVNGLRGETKSVSQMKKRIEHDIWYLENWSFFLDLKIVFLTAYKTIKGEDNAF
jgi:putative colanic acid biosynthesis UDP-glucose lipid carrier transferase